MLKIAVCGGQGKMARQLVDALVGHPEACCALVVHRPGYVGNPSTKDAIPSDSSLKGHPFDVAVDFSTTEGVLLHLDECLALKRPLVVAVTGMGAEVELKLQKASQQIPILIAPNTSLGIALLKKLASLATHVLGPQATYEIVETHHQFKKDAPSGTALSLGESIAAVWQKPLSDVAEFELDKKERSDINREPRIGFSSLRVGNVVGEHSLVMGLGDEVIELKHTGLNRQLFAQGAIKAAIWLAKQPVGLYSMSDVLGL